MNKKDYVIKVLNMVKDTMPIARWLIVLLDNSNIDENFLNILIDSFQDSINKIEDKKSRVLINKSKMFLENLKNKENEDKKLDEKDIEDLDKMLANI